MKNSKYEEQKKKLVSKNPQLSGYLLKLMMEWKLLEQRVDSAQQKKKNSVIVHTDFRLV